MFQDYIYGRHQIPTCPRCFPPERTPQSPSKEELTLQQFVSGLGFDPVFNSKRHIKEREIDILIPELNIAIEYCGLYYHGSNWQKNDYHLDKLKRCEDAGLRLITIFSDEWMQPFKRKIVENRLRHILNKQTDRLYARNTRVMVPTHGEVEDFLIKHHIQGTVVGATNCFGLAVGSTLVAVMTFGKPRNITNSADIRTEGHYELYRFASDQHVVGGASKLFKAFVRAVQPKQITSYCDRRWSVGGLYKTLGFELVRESDPAVWFVKSGVRYHRSNFQKHKLVAQGYDPNMTAEEIMIDRGYQLIYDCGSYTFVWKAANHK